MVLVNGIILSRIYIAGNMMLLDLLCSENVATNAPKHHQNVEGYACHSSEVEEQ